MPYVLFRNQFPELAERETRTITVINRDSPGDLPDGQYGLLEMFCDEPGCDCRRVFLYVVSSIHQRLEAVIAYGWETEAFYRRWLKSDDPRMIKDLQGPVLNLGSPQSELAPAILRVVRDIVLQDAGFVERIKRHYRMFRDRIDRRSSSLPVSTSGPLPRPVSRMINGNDPCPCGSGRKYKRCCRPPD